MGDSKFNLEQFFSKEKKKIDEELKKYFKLKLKQESVQNSLLLDFLKKVKDFILPSNLKGKRLHPIILISAFTGIANPQYSQEKIEDIRAISLAVEFIHNAKIIHDDLIDNDPIRRGNPSYHMIWNQQLKEIYSKEDFPDKNKVAKEFGEVMALLGGSLTFFFGNSIITNSNFPDELKFKALAEYCDAFNSINEGLIIEEYMYYNKIVMTLEQYLNIAELKTASLFEKSAKIGSILAKGNVLYQIKPLSDFMLKLGQAYSIRDDILDLEKDITLGDKKFPYIIAIQNTSEDQQKILNKLYGKPHLNKDEIKEIVNVINETQAIQIAQQFSMNLISQAKESLKKIYPGLNKKSEQFFIELVEYISTFQEF